MSSPLVEVHTIPTTTATATDAPPAARRARLNRPRWEPKVWHPVYEEIVLLSALGYSNLDIAADKGLTPVHISNILCTPQAKMIMRLVIGQYEKKRELTIDQRLNAIAEKAVGRVEEVIGNDAYAAKNPGGMFDRALSLLKATNKVKEPDAIVQRSTLVIPSEVFERFTVAMERSQRERRELAAPLGENFVTVKSA